MIQRFQILCGLTFVSLLFSWVEVSAQAIIGARGVALGNSTTSLHNNVWGLFSNPATITSNTYTVGFYGLRNYGLPELTDISTIINMHIAGIHSAFGFYKYGDDLYSETNFNAGFKYRYKGVHAGISAQYRHLKFGSNYGSGGAFNLTIGLLTQLNKSIWLGAKIRNINRSAYNFEVKQEALPQDISIGLMYNLEETAVFLFDIIKDVRFPISCQSGVEVEIIDNFVGRVGVITKPVTYTFGFGYVMHHWQINLAIQQHEVLGTSPGLDIILNIQ